jgi:hypothetical protein
MGKTIEVELNDAQFAQLTAEADMAGMKLFKYCRAKLTNTLPAAEYHGVPIKQVDRIVQPAMDRFIPAQDDRISRIEEAIANLTNFVLQGQPAAPDQAHPQDPIDVESLVDRQFREAEAQGLTEHVPNETEQHMADSGVRPLSRRPQPFSANSAPRHLQQLLG